MRSSLFGFTDPEPVPVRSPTIEKKIEEKYRRMIETKQHEFLTTYMTNRALSSTFTNAEEETKGALLCWSLIQKQFE